MNTQVPKPKASIAAAPLFHEPDEAANIHMELQRTAGHEPGQGAASALPLKRQGFGNT